MRGLEFGTKVDLHGIQCAMGTMQAVKLYEYVIAHQPDPEKAKAFVERFDYADWSRQLKEFLGASADTMIALEAKEGKYDKATHAARLDLILQNWENILQILKEELPTAARLEEIMDTIGISTDLNTLGVDSACAKQTFRATKDIRDKYVLSRLSWDLGILEELCELL